MDNNYIEEMMIRKWKPLMETYVDINMSNKLILLISRFAEDYQRPDKFMKLMDNYRDNYVMGDIEHNLGLYYLIFEPNSPVSRSIKINRIKNG